MRAKVRHRIFKSTFSSWETMCQEAEEFASTIPREDLISISQSADGGQGVIVIWYWSTAPSSNS